MSERGSVFFNLSNSRCTEMAGMGQKLVKNNCFTHGSQNRQHKKKCKESSVKSSPKRIVIFTQERLQNDKILHMSDDFYEPKVA